MPNKLAPYLSPPSRREFAETFRVAGRVSFWLQIALGTISGVALLFAIFSRSFSDEAGGNAGIGFSIFLAIVGLLLRVHPSYAMSMSTRHLNSRTVLLC